MKELLAPYGALKSFNLVMDKTTGKSKVGRITPQLEWRAMLGLATFAWLAHTQHTIRLADSALTLQCRNNTLAGSPKLKQHGLLQKSHDKRLACHIMQAVHAAGGDIGHLHGAHGMFS